MLRDTALENRGDIALHMSRVALRPGAPVERPDPAAAWQFGGIGPTWMIETGDGPVPARDIRPGMRVRTLSNGLQPVIWSGQERRPHIVQSDLSPVRFAAEAFGRAGSVGPGLLAPGQHLCLSHPANPVFFASEKVLCRAGDLVHLPGIRRAAGRYVMTWVHILLDRLDLIRADAVWLESMYPDMPMLRARRAAMARDLQDAVPALRFERGQAAYARQLPVLDGREVRLLDVQAMPG